MEESGLRLTRRLAGYMAKRMHEIGLSDLPDPRDPRGLRWDIGALTRAITSGMVTGCKGLAEVEDLTHTLTPAMRSLLGIPRRAPDTTMRSLLIEMGPDSLRQVLYREVHAALRRKALGPDGVPFGAVSMDGKATKTTIFDDEYAQVYRPKDALPYGLVRTVTSCLVSSAAMACLDAHPIPAETNEMGVFAPAFLRLLEVYPNSFFRVIMYDSGADSEENAALVTGHGKDYIFVLKGEQPTLLAEAERLLAQQGAAQVLATSDDTYSGRRVTRRMWASEEMAYFGGWSHLRTVIRVECKTEWQTEGKVTVEQHYYISSLPFDAMEPQQWLLLLRRRWGVENGCHHIWDRIFEEDKRPWVLKPKGMVAAMLLRRIGYNLLTLFRSVTQRDEIKRLVPWKKLMKSFFLAFCSATDSVVQGLAARAGAGATA